jgi:hypothetical protein
MKRASHSWQEACSLALAESEPYRFLGRLEYAVTVLERRYAEWQDHPGTPAELTAIEKAILDLERHLREKVAGRPVRPQSVTSTAPPQAVSDLGHVRQLFLVLRS